MKAEHAKEWHRMKDEMKYKVIFCIKYGIDQVLNGIEVFIHRMERIFHSFTHSFLCGWFSYLLIFVLLVSY